MGKVFEALKELDYIKDILKQIQYYNRDVKIDNSIYNSFDTIENALTTKSEKEQALEIIVKKEVNLTTFYYSTGSVETYNELIEIRIKPSAYEKCKLTQEEYDLLKEVLENED